MSQKNREQKSWTPIGELIKSRGSGVTVHLESHKEVVGGNSLYGERTHLRICPPASLGKYAMEHIEYEQRGNIRSPRHWKRIDHMPGVSGPWYQP